MTSGSRETSAGDKYFSVGLRCCALPHWFVALRVHLVGASNYREEEPMPTFENPAADAPTKSRQSCVVWRMRPGPSTTPATSTRCSGPSPQRSRP